MNAKDAARALNGSEYREEGSPALFDEMRKFGLVAVFGASDDLMEFCGAIDDEFGAGELVHLSSKGVVRNFCDNDDCPYHAEAVAGAPVIEALFAEEGNYTFTYRTSIPHETFEVVEDGEPYCRGIVFSLNHLAA